MKLHRWLTSCLLLVALAVAGCSPQESAALPKQEPSVEAVAAKAKGFAVGALMSAHTAYVFFDPQCPHCGHLWEASVPLHTQLKFVWIPIAFNERSPSLAQGAALLSAASPAALMKEHEASLLAGKGGLSASKDVAPDLAQAIRSNTALLNSFSIEAVPFILAKNARTGALVSNNGAMDTPALAEFLGVTVTP